MYDDKIQAFPHKKKAPENNFQVLFRLVREGQDSNLRFGITRKTA